MEVINNFKLKDNFPRKHSKRAAPKTCR